MILARAAHWLVVVLPLALWLGWPGSAGAISDPRDRAPMSQALNDLMQFAAPGRAVRWENPVTGNSGEVTAISAFTSGGQNCWEYERTYEVSGIVKVIQGSACELVPGLWQTTAEGPPRDKGSRSAAPAAAAAPGAAPAGPSYDRGKVREAQSLLTRLGYNPGPVDGAYGRRTRAALIAYQTDQGLDPSGEPSDGVLQSLRESVATTATAAPAPAPEPQRLPKASIPTVTPESLTSTGSRQGTEPRVATPQSAEPAAPAPTATPQPSQTGGSGDLAVPPPQPPPPPPE